MNEAPWQRRASAKWYVLLQGKHGTRCNANIENQISWYICTVVALLFLVARLSTRYQRLRSLGIDDGLITLAACCLIGDLIIQQYMWNLGMANIPKASREELIQIMKVFDVAQRHHGAHLLMRIKDDCPWVDSICHVIVGGQNRHGSVLQKACSARNKTAVNIQYCFGSLGCFLEHHFLEHYFPMLPSRQEMVHRSKLYARSHNSLAQKANDM